MLYFATFIGGVAAGLALSIAIEIAEDLEKEKRN